MRLDAIREKITRGKLAFGTHSSTTDLIFYEMCGMLDYDYVWIDYEHGPMNLSMIQNALIATNAGGAAAFVRVPNHDPSVVKPILEMGPDGIIFPMVNTKADAEECIAACTYPPRGVRGYCPIRAMDYGAKTLTEYLKEVDSSFLKILQCETKQAVENLEEILETPGCDAIICGPMDLSASIGKMGQLEDPEVLSLMETIIEKCRKYGKPYGVSIGVNLPLCTWWIERGASFVSMGTPGDYFFQMCKQVITQVREIEQTVHR